MPIVVVNQGVPRIAVVNPATPTASISSGAGLGPSDIPALVSFRHTQSAASATWTIVHNLNFFPNVTVIDSGGSMVEATITYTNNTSLTITFSSAISGVAYLS
jgi:hypothetical protein